VTSTDSEHGLALQRGEALCDLGRFADAERLLEGAVGRQPQDPDAWCLLAYAQIGNTNFDAALRSAQTAASLAPDAEWPHRLRSIVLANMSQTRLAVEAAETAVRLAPYTWQTHHCLAQALISTHHRAPEAIDAARRAVALAPHEAEAHFSLGAATAADGQRERAQDAFRTALTLDPQHSAAHNELARLELNRRLPTGPKRLATAASGFATSLRADPTASTARQNLDLVLRSFLSRLAYLIFVAAYLLLRLHLDSGLLEHSLPLLLLCIPAYVAARFVWHLPPPLRAHLLALITGRKFAFATATLAFAVTCLVVSSAASGSVRQTLSVVAVVSALIGRLVVAREMHEAVQQASDQPRKPWISSGLLTVLMIVLLLTAVIAFLTVQSSDSIALSVTAGMTCLLGGAAILRTLIRRH
jgi:Flp pilus assembly protein TadD, contains TPR repeats